VLNNLYPSVVDVFFDPNLRSVSEDKENNPNALNTIMSPTSERKKKVEGVLKEIKLETVHDYDDFKGHPEYELQIQDEGNDEQLDQKTDEEQIDREMELQDINESNRNEDQFYT
jgi:hypothetical protein